MRRFTVYRLHFEEPLHISSAREDYSDSARFVHSDTFYAALTQTWHLLHPDTPWEPDFRISSLFPFLKTKDKIHYYFPKPKWPVIVENDRDVDIKKMKKIRWLEKDAFEALLKGENIFLREWPPSPLTPSHSAFFPFAGETGQMAIYKSSLLTRVQVPRDLSKDSEPFPFEKIYFTKQAGLFFLLEGDTEDLEQLLDLMSKTGLGTDRTYGYGFFKYEKDEISLDIPADGEYQTNLSLFLPQTGTFDFGRVKYYGLLKRGGHISSFPYYSLRKKNVYMFEEGSVFNGNLNTEGNTVDLRPGNLVDHPVYRNGHAIFIPMKAIQ